MFDRNRMTQYFREVEKSRREEIGMGLKPPAESIHPIFKPFDHKELCRRIIDGDGDQEEMLAELIRLGASDKDLYFLVIAGTQLSVGNANSPLRSIVKTAHHILLSRVDEYFR